MNLSGLIEHTSLKPDVDSLIIKKTCEEAIANNFFAVCIPPYYVHDAKTILEETNVKVVTVIGYPFGYSGISSKVDEVKRAVSDGADEIDMVINICAVKDSRWAHVRNDIESVTMATHLKGKIMKIIIEAGLLRSEEIAKLCELCNDIGVEYIKTSTGVLAPGASVQMVKFISSCLQGTQIKIKASGGIKSKEFALELLNAGASRIGTSSGLDLIR